MFLEAALCFIDRDLSRGRDEILVAARRTFEVSLLSGLSCWGSFTEVPKRFGLDVFQYRTKDEEEYVWRLVALDPPLVTSWVGHENVDGRAVSFVKPQLCVDFFYLEKTSSQYWLSFVRNEQLTRAATGQAVLYRCVTQNNIFSAKTMIAYVKLTVGWSRIEMWMGNWAELSPVFTYKGCAMMNAQSGYWMVGYTKLVAKTVVFIVFDAYNNYRIWRLLRRTIAHMRKLSLKPDLESDRIFEEFEIILYLISEIYFRRLLQH